MSYEQGRVLAIPSRLGGRQQLQYVGKKHAALRGLWILRSEPIEVTAQ